jgi:L-evernosamine nitrososynthase
MPLELTANTEAGARLIALADILADKIGPDAAIHDRDGSFPFDSLAAVRRSGYLSAPIPEQLGGLGVTSVHDVVVASSRLARGDAALTLGVNMHLVYVLNVVRRWQMATAADDQRRSRAFGASLEQIARDGTLFAAATSEIGQDITRAGTTATRTEDGWLVSGHKVFCTMSPAADVLYTAVTYVDRDDSERYGYAMIPRMTPGVVVHDDWDALGMRASGSHSITFTDVELPAAALRGGFPVGEAVPYIDRNLTAGLFHASATLGIAESANALAMRKLGEQAANGIGRMATLAAEATIDLAVCRAVFERAANLIDQHYEAHPTSTGSDEAVTELFGEVQAAKAFISHAAPRIVDQALALSGGAGYLNGSPLARAYRDVRAVAFMHPLGDNRAYEFLAELALGREPTLH